MPEDTASEQELMDAIEEYAQKTAELHAAIREARLRGFTLRKIAGIVGLSVETVRKITLEEGS